MTFPSSSVWPPPGRFALALCLLVLAGCDPNVASDVRQASAPVVNGGPADAGPPIQFGYDEAGRLVAVYDTEGNSARYVYDEAGNLLEIARFTASELALHEFTPNAGPVGGTVTITGSGFRAVAAENGVTFNGVPAQVRSATAQRLVVGVPPGAVTGKLGVTVQGASVTSREDFTVTQTGQQGPVITGFTPNKGPVGTALTLEGAGFEPQPTANAVSVGGVGTRVTASSGTRLSVLAPAGGTGKVRVGTPSGTAVSEQDFFLVPAGYDTAKVEFTRRLTVDGAPVPVVLSHGSQAALLLFDAGGNDRLGLAVTGLDLGGGDSAQLQVIDTQGVVLWTRTLSSNDSFNLPVVPRMGTYTLGIKPGVNATRFAATVTLSRELTGTLTVGGPALTHATSRPGQDGRYRFTVAAGANVSLLFTGVTFPNSDLYATVYNASGGYVAGGWVSTSSSTVLDVKNTVEGTYTLHLDSRQVITGQATVRLNADVAGSVEVDGAATGVSLVPGQNGRYTFSGTAGDSLGLGVTGFVTSPANQTVYFTLFKPDGSSLSSCSLSASSSCNVPVLPVTGTYTLLVDPSGGASATLQVLLTRSVKGTLGVGGEAVTFATSRVGQDGQYRFTVAVGANVSLLFTGVTFPNSDLYATVYDPSGGYVTGTSVSMSSSTVLDVKNTVAGTYTLYLDSRQAITGQTTVRLNADVVGRVEVDGAATGVSLVPGQNGRYTFNGTAGDYLGLGVTGFVTSPTNQTVYFSLLKPDGTDLSSCSMSASSSCNVPVLPVTGAYTLLVDPSGGASATLQLLLSRSVQGTLGAGGEASTFATSRVGQDGQYRFTVAAGANVSLLLTGVTFPNSDLYATVYNPSGGYVTGSSVSTSSSTVLDVKSTVAGTYTLYLDPYRVATGQATVRLNADAVGSVEVDGAATGVSLVPGQNGRYTFSGTAGDSLGLGVTGFTTAPANQTVYFTLFKPDGSSLSSCSLSASSSCNVPVLPVTGTYTLLVDPSGGASATLQVLLTRSVQGTLGAGGEAVTFATSRVGQDGQYRFTVAVGANVSLLLTGVTFPNSDLYATVYNPSGGYVTGSSVSTSSSTVLDVKNTVAGTYTLYLDPYRVATGQATVRLNADAVGSVEVDGAATGVSLVPGQNGRYTFSGTAGDSLGLGVTGFTTAPTNQTVYFSLFKPDGSSLSSCSLSASSSCNVPVLPVTGTYTLLVDPSGGASATLQVLLTRSVQGTLSAGGEAVTFATSRVGQDGYYRFTVAAGANVSLLLTGVTFPNSDLYATVYNPSGGYVAGGWVSTSSTMVMDVKNTVAGTYTLYLDPRQAITGQTTVRLNEDVTGSVEVDGAATGVSLVPGQNGRYTFSGTTGDSLGLGVTGFVTSPTNQTVYFSLFKPDGSQLSNCSLSASSSCNVPVLPVTGTYTLLVDPSGGASATLQLLLSRPVQDTLTVGGATVLFATSRAGQDGRFRFSAMAGRNLGLTFSGRTFSAVSARILSPSGSVVWNDSISSTGNTATLTNVVTGTYLVELDPSLASTGQLSMTLK